MTVTIPEVLKQGLRVSIKRSPKTTKKAWTMLQMKMYVLLALSA